MRLGLIALLAAAPLALAACDSSDPFGLYPEPTREVVAPLQLTGRVVDEADLLTREQEAELTRMLQRFEVDTQAQLVVVTTPSLKGYTIEDYSLMLGRGWHIGSEGRDDGLLLVVAPAERMARIEVGHGLEETYDDVYCAEVLDDHILPRFREGDYPGGILAGTEELIAHFGPQATNDNDVPPTDLEDAA